MNVTNLMIVLLTIVVVGAASVALIPLLNRRDESPEARAARDERLADELAPRR